MPVTVGSAKKKGLYTFIELTAQKSLDLVSPAHILRSHVDSPYPIFLYYDD
jgi:hypothetical protein